MKKLFWVLVVLILCTFLSCRTYKTEYYYFYDETSNPEFVIDSLSKSYNVELIPLNEWNATQFFTNESTIVTSYEVFGKRNDSLFVFNVLQWGDSCYDVKLRIEYSKIKK